MAHHQGHIAAWQAGKGFGFIAPKTDAKQIFFHLNAWLGSLDGIEVGQLVNYDITTDTKGRVCAINVSPIAAMVDGMPFEATVLRCLPEKKCALLSHADYPNTHIILPQAAVTGVLPAVGQKVKGRLQLHKSGHWLLMQPQVVRAQNHSPSLQSVAAQTNKRPVKNMATDTKTTKASVYDGMSLTGRLEDWKDDKGYGFIRLEGQANRVFFHINDYIELNGRPANGMLLKFTLQRQEDDKWRAEAVQCLSAAASQKRQRSSSADQGEPVKIMVALVVALMFMAVLYHFEKWLALWALGWSVAAFLTYGADKQAALKKNWRVPENKLHLLDLLGGWPGGLIARQLWRHKTSKQTFVITFWLTVLINSVASFWLMRHAAMYLAAWL